MDDKNNSNQVLSIENAQNLLDNNHRLREALKYKIHNPSSFVNLRHLTVWTNISRQELENSGLIKSYSRGGKAVLVFSRTETSLFPQESQMVVNDESAEEVRQYLEEVATAFIEAGYEWPFSLDEDRIHYRWANNRDAIEQMLFEAHFDATDKGKEVEVENLGYPFSTPLSDGFKISDKAADMIEDEYNNFEEDPKKFIDNFESAIDSQKSGVFTAVNADTEGTFRVLASLCREYELEQDQIQELLYELERDIRSSDLTLGLEIRKALQEALGIEISEEELRQNVETT